ncbi:MAG: peptidoglycan editing factor PgeF [Gammaproteobacteria bacterium]|nr:peptidoglycan editing factor PgeF [Gammaproteobacteria bacterium]
MSAPEFLLPNWEAPDNVRAATSLRVGGVSQGNYAGFNLGDHVGDDPDAVAGNRRLLKGRLGLPAEPRWLAQVHGTDVLRVTGAAPDTPPEADAAWTDEPGQVLAILTADCLPVVFCNRAGTRIGIAHAGWRGLANGVLRATVEAMTADGLGHDQLLAWLGPAIGPDSFEVGTELLETFAAQLPGAEAAFKTHGHDKYLADLYDLARLELAGLGVGSVRGGGRDTFTETDAFFSHRRDGQGGVGKAGGTGRMATLAWLAVE